MSKMRKVIIYFENEKQEDIRLNVLTKYLKNTNFNNNAICHSSDENYIGNKPFLDDIMDESFDSIIYSKNIKEIEIESFSSREILQIYDYDQFKIINEEVNNKYLILTKILNTLDIKYELNIDKHFIKFDILNHNNSNIFIKLSLEYYNEYNSYQKRNISNEIVLAEFGIDKDINVINFGIYGYDEVDDYLEDVFILNESIFKEKNFLTLIKKHYGLKEEN